MKLPKATSTHRPFSVNRAASMRRKGRNRLERLTSRGQKESERHGPPSQSSSLMIHATLTSHPTTPCPAIMRCAVDVTSSGKSMELSYLLAGDISKLKIPSPASAAFTDGLWKHTCFELFIGNASEPSYVEFNFSPSTAWAAYRFA